jgi:anti-anti-sigma regulatory factor
MKSTMESTFQMQIRKSMGNLHIRLEGVFDPDSATSLARVLLKEESDCHRFFIDTTGLRHVEPLGTEALHAMMQHSSHLSSRIIFKGSNGQIIAMEGQRVLIAKPSHGCGCAGKCKVCTCAQRKERHKDQEDANSTKMVMNLPLVENENQN